MSFDSGNQYIRNHLNLVLDVKEGKVKEGGKIILWEPNGGSNQQWTITTIPGGEGYCTIDLANTGYCLDVEGGKMKNGTRILLWTKNGGYNQQWKFKVGVFLGCKR